MKKEIKDKWVAALLSGKYKQGMGYLNLNQKQKQENSFCCLGVLCDLHAQETGNKWKSRNESIVEYMNQITFLPEIVLEWAGMNDERGEFYHKTEGRVNLAELNDSGNYKFYQIAQLIESDWEKL